jgi:hypothetical protein
LISDCPAGGAVERQIGHHSQRAVFDKYAWQEFQKGALNYSFQPTRLLSSGIHMKDVVSQVRALRDLPVKAGRVGWALSEVDWIQSVLFEKLWKVLTDKVADLSEERVRTAHPVSSRSIRVGVNHEAAWCSEYRESGQG